MKPHFEIYWINGKAVCFAVNDEALKYIRQCDSMVSDKEMKILCNRLLYKCRYES